MQKAREGAREAIASPSVMPPKYNLNYHFVVSSSALTFWGQGSPPRILISIYGCINSKEGGSKEAEARSISFWGLVGIADGVGGAPTQEAFASRPPTPKGSLPTSKR